ncbi:hypothetical protein BGW39_011630 [Mortierella sp. 14UC]|nr:hypothetical protein BGW39_011630 [Mortierella sp. 14UC]
MAPSISHTVESEFQITPASLKAASYPAEALHDTHVEAAQEPTSVDPLATTASVPSSDDDMSENDSIDGTADNSSDAGADVTPTVTVVAAEVVAAETTEVVAVETVDVAAVEEAVESADEEEAVAIANSFAEGFSLEDRTETVVAPPQPPAVIEQAQTSSSESVPSLPSSPQPASASTPVSASSTVESKEDNEVALIAAAAAVVGAQEGEVPRKPMSRPLSRQELRRKSSFFNSKEIAISDQRFSSSTSASMRPIADPRFKSRFQNILSQWKSRE